MDLKVWGNRAPKKQSIILSSCDSAYFNEHGRPWAQSCAEYEMDCHVHIINPTSNDKELSEEMEMKLDPYLTVSYEKTDLTSIDKRVYYSCNRFLVANYLMRGCGRVMITDIDCLIMKKFDIPDANIGLFLRDPLPGTVGWEEYGTHVAAGVVSYSGEIGRSFIKGVSETIYENANGAAGWRWFLDQVCIWAVYKGMMAEIDGVTVHKYKKEFLDWEFVEGTEIWTGKGDRKHKDLVYVKAKEDVTERYNS